MNGLLLNEKKVYVGRFVSRTQRKLSEVSPDFTNIYVKNFKDSLDEKRLQSMFQVFGASALVLLHNV